MGLASRTRVLAAVLAVAMLAFTGCGDDDDDDAGADATTTAAVGGESTTTSEALEPETFKLATVTANGVDQSALLVGNEQGIFEECGITMEFAAFNSNPDVIRASTSGATNMSWAGLSGVITGYHNGEDLSVVSGAFLTAAGLGWVVPTGSDIEDVADLEGKRIGVPSLLGPADSALHFILDEEGIEAESVVVGGIQDGLAAMASGAVDATYMGDPTMTTQVSAGNVRTVMLVDDYTEYQTAVLVGPTSWVEANADLIDRFLDCVDQANEYMQENPEEAGEVFAEVGGIEPDVAVTVVENAVERGAYSREVNQEALEFAINQLKTGGAVPPEFSRSDLDGLFEHLREP